MKKNNKKTRFVLKKGWQTLLEIIATLTFMLLVSTVDSDWTIEYFKFVGILIAMFSVSVTLIAKFGNPNKN
jgi:hypothetical protein